MIEIEVVMSTLLIPGRISSSKKRRMSNVGSESMIEIRDCRRNENPILGEERSNYKAFAMIYLLSRKARATFATGESRHAYTQKILTPQMSHEIHAEPPLFR